MLSKPWLSKELGEDKDSYFTTSLNKSLEDNYDFLKRNNFEYAVLGASCVIKFKADSQLVSNRIQEMANSDKFKLVKNTDTEFLFRVN
jgi:hypothetical protein